MFSEDNGLRRSSILGILNAKNAESHISNILKTFSTVYLFYVLSTSHGVFYFFYFPSANKFSVRKIFAPENEKKRFIL